MGSNQLSKCVWRMFTDEDRHQLQLHGANDIHLKPWNQTQFTVYPSSPTTWWSYGKFLRKETGLRVQRLTLSNTASWWLLKTSLIPSGVSSDALSPFFLSPSSSVSLFILSTICCFQLVIRVLRLVLPKLMFRCHHSPRSDWREFPCYWVCPEYKRTSKRVFLCIMTANRT